MCLLTFGKRLAPRISLLRVRSDVASGKTALCQTTIVRVAFYVASEFVGGFKIIDAVLDAFALSGERFVKNLTSQQLTFLPESTFNRSDRNGHVSENRAEDNGENGNGLHVLGDLS
jgi:hypothetical protein